jgi:hypothetical protein
MRLIYHPDAEAELIEKRVSPAYHRFLVACFFVFVRALLIPLIP